MKEEMKEEEEKEEEKEMDLGGDRREESTGDRDRAGS